MDQAETLRKLLHHHPNEAEVQYPGGLMVLPVPLDDSVHPNGGVKRLQELESLMRGWLSGTPYPSLHGDGKESS